MELLETNAVSPEVSNWSARNYSNFSELIEGLRKPNAACPDCHRPVFHFASKQGHGEYFDCLGPSWARHPCVDGGRLKRIIKRLQADRKKAGPGVTPPPYPAWEPFWVKSISSVTQQRGMKKLTGDVATGTLTLLVVDARLDINAPFYVWHQQRHWYVQTLIGSSDWLVDRVFEAKELELDESFARSESLKPSLQDDANGRKMTADLRNEVKRSG